ncbi:hypothetical protein L9F63_005363, partial [Diploptera punctata]
MWCRPDLWIVWFVLLLLKCLMKPIIILKYLRRSKKLPKIDNKLLFQSATNLAFLIRTRKVKSEEVVKAYIARIQDVNPLLNAMVDHRFEAAVLDARYVDRLIESGVKTEQQLEAETPLLGVPFTVKGSIGVKGLSHSAGEVRFENRRAQQDAETVKLMRAAGAIPILVSNTPELCMYIETFNKIIGTTNNPYDLRRTPSGSSGGEVSSLDPRASVIGLGSDIAGSLRIPAAFTGIFSHKPTPGLVSHYGHNPTSPDMNWYRYFTIGPMARYCEDLSLMLSILSGKQGKSLKLDQKVDIKSLKFYYMEDDGGCIATNKVSQEVKAALRKVVAHLQNVHGIEAKKVNLKQFKYACDISLPLILNLNGVTSLHRNDAHPKPWGTVFIEMIKFIFCMSEYTLSPLLYAFLKRVSVWMPDRKIQRIREKADLLRKEFHEILGDDGVFLYPTFIETAPFHKETYFKLFNAHYTLIMNILEVPVTNCPVGLSKNGLPIGIQVVGAPNEDRLTLAVAKEIESAFGGWTEPPKPSPTSQKSLDLKKKEKKLHCIIGILF